MNKRRRLRIASQVTGPALLCALAGLVFGQLFDSAQVNLVLVGAALIPTLLAVMVTRGTPTRVLAAVAIGAAGLAAYSLEAAAAHVAGGVPGARAWDAFGRGLADGWKQLLTVGLPATPNGSLEITPVAIVGAAALAAALLALRPSAVLAPLGPPTAAFVAALMFGSGRPSPSDLTYAGAFVVVAVLTLIIRSESERSDSPVSASVSPWAPAGAGDDSTPLAGVTRPGPAMVSRAGFALPAALATVAIAFGVTNALPVASGTHRFDPRRYLHQAIQVNDQVSPLVELNALLAEKKSTLFQVTVQPSGGAVTPDRMQVAVLNAFDGTYWTSNASFVVTGSRLEDSPHSPGRLSETVTALSPQAWQLGPYLPVAGTPLRISGAAGSVYDQAGGELATTAADPGAYRYALVASPLVGAATVSPHGASIPAEPAVLTAYPLDIPQKLVAVVNSIASTDQTPASRLAAIEAYLQTHESYDPAAPPGESIAALTRFVDGTPGDSAQFAEAFALMARYEGIPARIAVGYLLRQVSGPGQFLVTTADAYAWPEVDLSPYGWVAYDPANHAHQVAGPRQQLPKQASQGNNSAASGGGISQPGSQPSAAGSITGSGGGGVGGGSGVAGAVRTASLWGLVALAGLAGPPAAILAAKRRRRHHRLRAPTPGERVLGAWREARDRLLEHGLNLPWALTPVEAASAAEDHFAPTPPAAINDLALLVTGVLYSPYGVEEPEADQSWNLLGSLEEELTRLDTRLSQWRRRLDPRPLVAPGPEVRPVDRAVAGAGA